MIKKYRKNIIVVLCVTIMIMIIASLSTTVNAKTHIPRNGRYIDGQGCVYIMKHGKPRTGWFKYHGKTYYGHKTESACYPKGSVSQNTFRVKHGRMYFFNNKGEKITRDIDYVKLRHHRTSVHYVLIPGTPWMRYNAKHKRYQWLRGSKWCDVGMQCYPDGWIDWQK